ncbi:MAG TPA: amidohydrolase family protein [Gammaproteobacteria bacterium]|nr:amidohydrolase family protein [Gammaproteobacteria bacterium]
MTPADLVIHARWVIPVEPEGAILEQHAIVVRDGRILALLPGVEARRQYHARTSVELPGHVLIPGFVNAHTHAAISLLVGAAENLSPTRSLPEPAWTTASRWLSAECVRAGSELAMVRMLRSGTTCFNDMYFFPEVTAEAAQRCGLRACLGMIVSEAPSAWAGGAHEYLAKGTALRDRYKDEPLLSFAFAPIAPCAMAASRLKEIRTLADELDVPVHAEINATVAEIQHSLQQHGVRPLAYLGELGWLTSNLVAVYMTLPTASEIAGLARAGVQVVHCPESSLGLARGFCPLAKLMAAGVNVALGSGGRAFDMLAEMRCGALLAEAVADDAAAVVPASVLRMATLNGARALGLDHATGSLLPGKWADLTAVDMSVPECQPLYDPLPQMVYSASRSQVSDVWVAGRQLLRAGALTTLDQDAILAHASRWQESGRSATSEAASA